MGFFFLFKNACIHTYMCIKNIKFNIEVAYIKILIQYRIIVVERIKRLSDKYRLLSILFNFFFKVIYIFILKPCKILYKILIIIIKAILRFYLPESWDEVVRQIPLYKKLFINIYLKIFPKLYAWFKYNWRVFYLIPWVLVNGSFFRFLFIWTRNWWKFNYPQRIYPKYIELRHLFLKKIKNLYKNFFIYINKLFKILSEFTIFTNETSNIISNFSEKIYFLYKLLINLGNCITSLTNSSSSYFYRLFTRSFKFLNNSFQYINNFFNKISLIAFYNIIKNFKISDNKFINILFLFFIAFVILFFFILIYLYLI